MSKEKERLFSAIAAEETFFMFSKNELVFSGFYSSSRKSKETGHAAGSGVIELGQGILLSFRA